MNSIIGGAIMTSLLIPQLMLSVQPVAPSVNKDGEAGGGITLPAGSEEPSIGTRDQDEILWLARAIHSETDIKKEMYFVGWVIKNRVDNAYMGDTTYKAVVTHSGQFSGLNAGDPHYAKNISMTRDNPNPTWKQALAVAKEIYYADSDNRPMDRWIQHFYSPGVVAPPAWADDERLVFVSRSKTGEVRFAFYKDVR